ncbi:NUDIX domain-containing protein [Microbacteriaceae bacterium]|nr:NUDIX domain-containing protein [Candidatus Saccharibacteria bacterium]
MRYRHAPFYYAVVRPLLHLVWLAPSRYLRIVRPNLKPRTRVLIITDSHILLIKNVVGSSQWTLPGGGYHRNESAEDCAKREVKEELGINLTSLAPIGKANENAKGMIWNYDCFVGHLDARTSVTLSYEISEAQWFPRNNVPVAVRPYALTIINRYAPPTTTP